MQRASRPPGPSLGVQLSGLVGRVRGQAADRVHRGAAPVEGVDPGQVAGDQVGAGRGTVRHRRLDVGDTCRLEVEVRHARQPRAAGQAVEIATGTLKSRKLLPVYPVKFAIR